MDEHSPAQRAPVSAFRSFLNEDWTAWLADYPQMGTFYGYPGDNDRWTDDSTEGVARRRRHPASALSKLKTFKREELPPEERTNFDLYLSLFEEALQGQAFGEDALPFHFGMP